MIKKELRIKYTEKRFHITKNEIEIQSKLISDIISENFDLKQKVISLFLPIESKNEINTFLILEFAKSQNAKIAIPKSIFETSELIHYEFNDLNQLKINKFNIPEPISGNIISDELFDIVFIPLLTIDKKGYRVGYGKGFYDRFLNKCKKECLFIGLYLFDEFEVIDDLNEYDLPLQFCVTPNQLINFNL